VTTSDIGTPVLSATQVGNIPQYRHNETYERSDHRSIHVPTHSHKVCTCYLRWHPGGASCHFMLKLLHTKHMFLGSVTAHVLILTDPDVPHEWNMLYYYSICRRI